MRISSSSMGFWSNGRLADVAEGWVHPNIECDSSAFGAHVDFLVWSVFFSSAAVIAVPVFLAFGGSLGAIGTATALILLVPIFCSYLVSKTGRLDWGVIGLLAGFSSSVVALSLLSGGVYSPLTALLGIVPIEATIRLGKRGLKLGLGLACASLVCLIVLTFQLNVSSIDNPAIWQIVSTGVVLAYAFSLATRFGMLRAQVSRDLTESQELADFVSKITTDVLSRHDSAGNTSYVSPSARTVLGVSPRELLNSGLLDRIHLQDRIVFLSKMSDAANGGQEETLQIRLQCQDTINPDWKWVEMRCRRLENPATKAVEVVAATRDISELKEQQAQIEKSNDASENSDQAQRRFLAIMSHELRTPLNAILGFSDILRQEQLGKLPDKRQREYVELIHDSGLHLLNLVNDLLDVSRIASAKYELTLETFSIAESVDVTLNMLQQIAADANVVIRRDVPDSLPDLVADSRCCKQILINLISNAIKFTNEGGEVQVSVKHEDEFLIVEVADNGIGIREDFIPKIGLPFMQADNGRDRKYEGSGLGLSVVKGLVELHNGTFKLESKLGQGTTVFVTLPVNEQAAVVVPADEKKSLVNLNERTNLNKSFEIETKQTPKEGDNRARVSA